VYYHQYVLSFQYKTPYESFPAPDLQITSFGAPVRLPLNQGFTSVWGDNGTSIVLAGNQTYLSQGERWAESTRIPGNLTSSMIITLRFVHQYEVTLSYTIVGGGNPTSPEIVGFSLERPLEANVTMQGSTFWLDATTPWSVSSILPGGTSGVRWVAATQIGGNLTGSLEASVSYVHQYYVTVNPVSTGGSTSLSSGWYDANSNLSLSANPSLGWIFGHWVGAYSGENSTVAVQLKGPVQETPVFEAILQISTGSMGSVTYVTNGASHVVGPMRSAAVSVEQGGNVTLLASPSSFFYTFAGWGGNLSSDDPRIALAVTSPAEIRASFSLNYFAVVGVIAVWVIGVSFVSFLILRRRQSLRRLLEPFQRLKGGPNQ